MTLTSYTQTRANKLIKLSVSNIEEPIGIKVLWIRASSFENSDKAISKKKHKHSFFEAHFTFSGEINYVTSDGSSYSVCDGMGIMFSPNTSHTVKSFKNDLIKFSIAFTPIQKNKIFTEMASKSTLIFKIDNIVESDFNKILQEADSKSIFSQTLIKNSLLSIICSLARISGADIVNESHPNCAYDNMNIERAKQYIDDNKNLFLTCQDVAQYCHFNVKYLSRVFKEKTGITLLKYIHLVKTKEAEKLLLDSSLSLEQISQMLGFANEYYFNSFFKRQSGMSPGTYRKLTQKN